MYDLSLNIYTCVSNVNTYMYRGPGWFNELGSWIT